MQEKTRGVHRVYFRSGKIISLPLFPWRGKITLYIECSWLVLKQYVITKKIINMFEKIIDLINIIKLKKIILLFKFLEYVDFYS